MRIEYNITGTLTLPEGTTPIEGNDNSYRLPTGEVFSVHPVIEVTDDMEDDYRDLSEAEARSIGVEFEDYDRTSYEVPA